MKIKKLMLVVLLLTFILPIYAAKYSLAIPRYYDASCNDITGVWQGFMADPTDLFYDGGPWPITINFHYKNGKIIGQTSSNKVWKKQKIWADCRDGVITKLFAGKHRNYAPNGLLVAKHSLVLYLPFRGAMTGTDFLVFLKKNK